MGHFHNDDPRINGSPIGLHEKLPPKEHTAAYFHPVGKGTPL